MENGSWPMVMHLRGRFVRCGCSFFQQSAHKITTLAAHVAPYFASDPRGDKKKSTKKGGEGKVIKLFI
jgi:hypothetical protein